MPIPRSLVTMIAIACAAPCAHAAMFTPISGFVSLEVDGGTPHIVSSPTPLTGSTTGTTPQSGTATVSFTESPQLIRLEGEWDGAGTNGFASTVSVFQGAWGADMEAEIEVSWNLAGMDSGVVWNLFTTDGTFISYSGGSLPTTGTQSFVLGAGETISFENGLAGFDGRVARFEGEPNVPQFIQIAIVPGPSGGALLCVTLCVGCRRRR